jgi:hypothetical protein
VTNRQSNSPVRAVILAALSALACAAAQADTSREFWPEFDAFLKLDPRTRVFLMANSSHPEDNEKLAVASPATEAAVGAYLDYSLVPVLRPDLREQDWARSRYFWGRVGYQYSHSTSASDAGKPYHQNMGVFEMTARTPPLAGQVEWVARARWDWRNKDGTNSSLYRVRLSAERQFDLRGHAAVPYVTAEAIYDTRYSSWEQRRYQVGTEFAIDGNWRVEPYFEMRKYTESEPSTVLGFGLTLKYFR